MLVESVFILLVGVVVGVINGMAGGASILSYPALLAVGLNPLSAVVSNAIGVTSANFLSLRAQKAQWRNLVRTNAPLIYASVTGTIIGAIALLNMPISALERLAPFLMLFATSTLFMPQRRSVALHPRTERGLMFGTGLYCGYFGPGQGVMVALTLARDSSRSPIVLNTTKNIIVGITALVSNVLYIFSGHVSWWFTFMLAIGAAVGGHLGGSWANRISPQFYRRVIFLVGFTSSIWLFTKYY